jgi:hypothetical protein
MPTSHKLTPDEISYINEEMSNQHIRGARTAQVLADMFDVQRGAIYYQFNKFRGNKYTYAPPGYSTPIAAITVAPEAIEPIVDAPVPPDDTLAALLYAKSEYAGVAMEMEKISIKVRNYIGAVDMVIDELENHQLIRSSQDYIADLERKLEASTNTLERFKSEIDQTRKEFQDFKNRPTHGD